MRKRNKTAGLTDVQIDQLVIEEAHDPTAWEDPVVVPPSTSKRPDWIADAKRQSEESPLPSRRQAVSSSVIASVAYDPATKTLEVTFHNGRVYRYFEITEAMFDDLVSATSAGAYFQQKIKDRYRSQEVAQRLG